MSVSRRVFVRSNGPRRGAPSPRSDQREGWAGDDRGALLILTGILLVLGFVVLGTTLVQLNSSEDKVTRSQRDPMMDSVDTLVRGFSDGIRGGVQLGDTNLEQFASYSDAQEDLFRDTATQVGLYVDTKLNPDPPLNIFTGPNQCAVYDTVRSQDGIIIGYEKDTLTETIVGAVYTLEFTDGRQSVTMDYYVKIYECTPGELSTFAKGLGQHMGGANVDGIPALKDPDDEHQGITIVEELTGDVSVDAYTHWKGLVLTPVGWNNGENIAKNDNSFAVRPSPPLTDVLLFNFTTNDAMNATKQQQGLVFNDFRLDIDAYHVVANSLLGTDDGLRLSYYNIGSLSTPLWTYDFPTLATSETRYEIYPPAPSGNPEWTPEELEDTAWQLTVKVNGVKDGDHTFHIDFIRPNVTYSAPQGHQIMMEFEWKQDGIPQYYRDHVVEAVYQIPTATAGESFQMQTWNLTTQAWEDLGDPWAMTGATWLTWTAPLVAGHHYVVDEDPDVPLLRLVDKDHDDNGITDRDTVYIDYLRVTSQASF